MYYDQFLYAGLLHCIVYCIEQPPSIIVIGPSHFIFSRSISINDMQFKQIDDITYVGQDSVKFQLEKCDLSGFAEYNFDNSDAISAIMDAFISVKNGEKITNYQINEIANYLFNMYS